jgi:hypothetical protein
MGGTGANPCTARGSSVIRMRQGTVPREASPPRDGVLALAFRTLLSFQGTSPGCSSATHLRFPRPVAAGAAGRYHGPFKIVKDFPPVRSASVLLVEHRRHRHTEAPPCHPEPPGASGRPPNSRWIELLWRSATSCLPMATRRRRPGEVLGLEELPCLQLGEGSTGFDSVSTCYQPLDTFTHNGSSGLAGCNGRRWAGIPQAVRPPTAT